MAIAPILKTKRLTLLPFSETYLTENYVSWLNNPKVTQFSEQRHRIHTKQTSYEYWQGFNNTPHYFWAIVENAEGLGHIGNINAYLDLNNQIADVGILIGELNAWGQGYGLEAWEAVCDYLLKQRKLRKLTAGTLATNTAMISIMEKVGMIFDGKRYKHFLVDNKEVDLVYYALFNENI